MKKISLIFLLIILINPLSYSQVTRSNIIFEKVYNVQKIRIYNALKNSDSDSVMKFKTILNKIINE